MPPTPAPTTPPTPLAPRQRAWLTALGVLGALLVLFRLTAPQVLPDEVVYLDAGESLVAGGGDPNPEHPPLAKLLFGLAGRLVGDPLLGGRLVGALAAATIAALLFWLVRRIAGNRAGVLAAGLWLVLPVGGGATGPLADAGRLDRFAMLDPVATALAVGAVAAGWSWLVRPRWQAAALTGLLGGLAAGAKPTGVLVLPAIALVVLWRHRDRWPRSGAGVAIAVLASLAGLALAYAPLGTAAPAAFRHLVEFQTTHAAEGHVVVVAGTSTAFPPWWAHLWFHLRDDGWLLTLVLFVGAAAGLAHGLRRRAAEPRLGRGVALLGAALATHLVVLSASPVKLPFYRYAWLPWLVALLAIALDAGSRAVGPGARPADEDARRRAVAVGAFAGVGAWLVAGVALAHVADVVSLRPGGYAQVAEVLVRGDGSPKPAAERLLLRARPAVLAFHLDRVAPGAAVGRVDRLEEAELVLLDPEITSRFPIPAVDGVVDDPAWGCLGFGDLVLCRRGTAAPSSP